MAVLRVDAGFVNADTALVGFLAEVFELQVLTPIELPHVTIHCLQGPGSVLKVMVPRVAPNAALPFEPTHHREGLRYLTLQVDDLQAVVERAVARGARIDQGPEELVPGVRFVVFEDPYGNILEAFEGQGLSGADREALAEAHQP